LSRGTCGGHLGDGSEQVVVRRVVELVAGLKLCGQDSSAEELTEIVIPMQE
jgi:hypothetical protein